MGKLRGRPPNDNKRSSPKGSTIKPSSLKALEYRRRNIASKRHYCQICDKTCGTLAELKSHTKTKSHQAKLIVQEGSQKGGDSDLTTNKALVRVELIKPQELPFNTRSLFDTLCQRIEDFETELTVMQSSIEIAMRKMHVELRQMKDQLRMLIDLARDSSS